MHSLKHLYYTTYIKLLKIFSYFVEIFVRFRVEIAHSFLNETKKKSLILVHCFDYGFPSNFLLYHLFSVCINYIFVLDELVDIRRCSMPLIVENIFI